VANKVSDFALISYFLNSKGCRKNTLFRPVEKRTALPRTLLRGVCITTFGSSLLAGQPCSSRNELRYRIYLRKAVLSARKKFHRLCSVPFFPAKSKKLATNFHFRYDNALFLRKELLTTHFRYDTRNLVRASAGSALLGQFVLFAPFPSTKKVPKAHTSVLMIFPCEAQRHPWPL